MKKIATFFVKESRRYLCKKILIVLLAVLVLAEYGVLTTTTEYNKVLADSVEFQKIEDLIFQKVINYPRYSVTGHNLLFIPDASMIFCTIPATLSEVSASIDSIITMNINNNCKSKALFKGSSIFSLNYDNIVLLLGSILASIFGFGTFRKREYLKMLVSNWTAKKVFIAITVSRVILLIISFLLITAVVLVTVLLKNIALTNDFYAGLSHFLLISLLMLVFFFFTGVLVGIFKSRGKEIAALVIIMFVFLKLIPDINHSIINKESDRIPLTFKVENGKLKIVNEFETRTERKYGKLNMDKIEIERKIVESYWSNEHKAIEALEENLRNQIAGVVKTRENLSMFFPTTFYTLTCSEISSGGYKSFLEFYAYVIETHGAFLRFWIDRFYYNDPDVLVSFIKDDENLFRSKSRLPDNYFTGILINLGYIILLNILSYLQFKRSLYGMKKEEISKMGFVEVDLNKPYEGEISPWKTEGDTFNNLLYNLFSGRTGAMVKMGFKGSIKLNEADIASTPYKDGFLYVCRPEELPGDIKAGDFIKFFSSFNQIPAGDRKTILSGPKIKPIKNKTIANLKKSEALNVLLAVINMKKHPLYLFNDTAATVPFESALVLKDKMDALVKSDKSRVVYLYKTEMEVNFNKLTAPDEMKHYFAEGYEWVLFLEGNRRILNDRKTRNMQSTKST